MISAGRHEHNRYLLRTPLVKCRRPYSTKSASRIPTLRMLNLTSTFAHCNTLQRGFFLHARHAKELSSGNSLASFGFSPRQSMTTNSTLPVNQLLPKIEAYARKMSEEAIDVEDLWGKNHKLVEKLANERKPGGPSTGRA